MGEGYGVNTSMPTLDCLHSTLSTSVPGIKREDMAHLSRALFCPCLACKGEIKVHGSNGTYVALAEKGMVLYARCADRTCVCGEEDIKSGWMDVLEGTGARPWIKLTEEKLEELESKLQTHPRMKKART
jgi:hypothetical protein